MKNMNHFPMRSSDSGPAWTTTVQKGISPDAHLAGVGIARAPADTQKVKISDIYIRNNAVVDLNFVLKSKDTGTEFFWFKCFSKDDKQITLRDLIECPDVGENVELWSDQAGSFNYYVASHNE